jgi:hypothetical protein
MQVGAFPWTKWLAGVRDGVVEFGFVMLNIDDIHLGAVSGLLDILIPRD